MAVRICSGKVLRCNWSQEQGIRCFVLSHNETCLGTGFVLLFYVNCPRIIELQRSPKTAHQHFTSENAGRCQCALPQTASRLDDGTRDARSGFQLGAGFRLELFRHGK